MELLYDAARDCAVYWCPYCENAYDESDPSVVEGSASLTAKREKEGK
jgi:hypothetical protein